ncbi:HlyD family secretion protein [bacterium]|nr:HlyD family secretion protein [bacterium]
MDENKEQETVEGKKEPKFKLPKGTKRTIGTILAIVFLIWLTLFIINETKYQSTDDAYVENHTVNVSPKVSGQIVEVLVQDNQRVKAGELVAVIDNADYIVSANKARAQYEKALAGQKVAKANYNAVQIEINNAKADLERYKNLYKTGAVSKQQLDLAQTKYEATQARLINADENVMSPEQDKVADADIKVLKAEKDKAELNLSYTKIYAPQDGTVSNKRVEVGAYVQTGSPLFVIIPNEIWVVANFKENQVGLMKKGQPVDIKIDAYPNKVFKGKVDSIQRASGAKSSLFPPENAVGSFVKIVQRIPVKIIFDEEINPNEYNIVPGMSVVPKVRVK